MNAALFSSATDEWATPTDLFEQLNTRYKFTIDVCATKENAKCTAYFTREQDGLKQPWSGVCWMNPPYGRQIGAWVEKACKAAQNGATVVALLPARTDTKWFHEWVQGKANIEFLRGRLKFGGAKWNAPFPCMIAVYGSEQNGG